MICARCGITIRSDSGQKGECSVCGAPLCYRCVLLDKATHCSEHAKSAQDVGEACGACGREGLTPHNSARCTSPDCSRRICKSCLEGGVRECVDHQRPVPRAGLTDAPLEPARLVTCSACGKAISPSAIGRRCRQPECSNPICLDCMKQGHQWCGEHLASATREARPPKRRSDPRPAAGKPARAADTPAPRALEQSEQSRQAMRERAAADAPPPNATALVSAGQARVRLLNFFGRLRRRMAQPRRVGLPDGSSLECPGWQQPSWTDDGTREAEALLEALGPSPTVPTPSAVPVARAERYELAPRSWRSLGMCRRRVVIEAIAIVRPTRHIVHGGDWEPADLLDHLDDIQAAAERADECGYFHVLCLYSPTGWNDRSVQAIAGASVDERLMFPALKVALAGPGVSDLQHNSHDTRVAELNDLLQLETDEERLAAMAETIRERLCGRLGITLEEATEALGCSEEDAARVFDLIAVAAPWELLTSASGELMLATK